MSEGKHYVYTLAYPESMGNNVFYVGKGTRNRVHQHEQEAKRNIKSYKCNTIRKIWNNNGQVISKKVAFFETDKEAYLYEYALIFFMKGYGYLTNLADGGKGALGTKHTEETRRKMSLIHTGKPKSEEHRRKTAEANRGRKYTEETRRKFSEAQKASQRAQEALRKTNEARRGKPSPKKGIPLSEEQRQKLSKSHKGRQLTERQKLANEMRRGRPGKPHTEETRRKMSLSKKGRPGKPHTEEEKIKIAQSNRITRTNKRMQQLQYLREPIIATGDASWKNGLVPMTLWNDTESA